MCKTFAKIGQHVAIQIITLTPYIILGKRTAVPSLRQPFWRLLTDRAFELPQPSRNFIAKPLQARLVVGCVRRVRLTDPRVDIFQDLLPLDEEVPTNDVLKGSLRRL